MARLKVKLVKSPIGYPKDQKAALKALGLPPQEVAVVGDQIFTDVLGGNLVGAYTVLVPPLREREFFYTRFIRMLETPFRRPRGGLG